jgi:hypothetical protein
MTGHISEDRFRKSVDRRHDELKDRMLVILGNLRDAFRADGYTASDPSDWSDEEYSYAVIVEGNGLPELVDVRLTMAESMTYGDGTEGVNFALDITGEGGRILGGMTPYNYSPDVWVPVRDSAAVSDRLALLEGADPDSAVDLVREAYGASEGHVNEGGNNGD